MTTANVYQQRPTTGARAESSLHHADLASLVGKGRKNAGVTVREIANAVRAPPYAKSPSDALRRVIALRICPVRSAPAIAPSPDAATSHAKYRGSSSTCTLFSCCRLTSRLSSMSAVGVS